MKIRKLFGPPGTGKTTTLMEIMEEELARGTSPERIAFLTFTVNARKVATGRVFEKFKLGEEELPYFRTLHSIAYHELGVGRDAMIRGPQDLKAFSNLVGVQFSFKQRHRDDDMLDLPMGAEVGDRLLLADHLRRHRLQSVDEAWMGRLDLDFNIYQIRRFCHAYDAWKQAEGVRDFTDLLEQVTEPLDVDVVIVDEAQDLSKLQWQALHVLWRNAERVYIAGDDDQAIFTWAGADPDSFVQHVGDVEVLGQSYRIPRRLHPLATHLVTGIRGRQPKEWRPRDGDQGAVYFRPEFRGLPDGEGSIRVLYRHHYLAGDIEEQLRAQGIPYTRSDRQAPGAEWGPNIISYERLRSGKRLTWSEANKAVEGLAVGHGITAEGRKLLKSADRNGYYNHVVMVSSFGVDATLLMRPWYEALTKILPADRHYIRLLLSRHGKDGLVKTPRVHMGTIHASKGDEGDHVVLLTDMSSATKDSLELNPDVERRTFYVGVTRARKTLTVVGVDNPLFR